MTNPGPGPEERKLKNRMIFTITGRWPQSVVTERLSHMHYDDTNVRAIMDELWKDVPGGWPGAGR